MAIFDSTKAKVLMPRQILDGMVKDAQTGSTVAQLSGREAMRFGEADIVVFNDLPKMEYVEEGADKSPTQAGFTNVTAKPHKGQVTLRFNEEVQWADEDYQLGILREVATAGQEALARGLDLGVYHRINPLTGEAINTWDNYVGKASQAVVLDGSAEADKQLRAAVGLLMNTKAPKPVNGVAMDPRFAWELTELVDKDGRQRYPQLGLGTAISGFLGLPASVGNTVSGQPEASADTKIRAIVGDFQSGIRWGVQRQLPIEIIRFGDPDGQGDLKRKNQIALRLEIVYAWHVFADRFALVKAQ